MLPLWEDAFGLTAPFGPDAILGSAKLVRFRATAIQAVLRRCL